MERCGAMWSDVERVWNAVEWGGMQWNASAIVLEFELLQYLCLKHLIISVYTVYLNISIYTFETSAPKVGLYYVVLRNFTT